MYGNIYNFAPLTFTLPNEYNKFLDTFTRKVPLQTHEVSIKDDQVNKGIINTERDMWICKPTDMSRGRGIFLLSDIGQLNFDQPYIVQRYISNPLLIGGYKWDLRIYVLVTSLSPLKIHIFEEGLVRFSTQKFTLSNISNKFIHLTNTSINKHSPDLDESKYIIGKGSKWTLHQLKEYFHEQRFNFTQLFSKIEEIILLVLISIGTENHNYNVKGNNPFSQLSGVKANDNCFELFGFDILVDMNFKPWLLEINSPPQLQIDCDVDRIIKPKLIRDIISLVFNQEKHTESDSTTSRFGFGNQALSPTPSSYKGFDSKIVNPYLRDQALMQSSPLHSRPLAPNQSYLTKFSQNLGNNTLQQREKLMMMNQESINSLGFLPIHIENSKVATQTFGVRKSSLGYIKVSQNQTQEMHAANKSKVIDRYLNNTCKLPGLKQEILQKLRVSLKQTNQLEQQATAQPLLTSKKSSLNFGFKQIFPFNQISKDLSIQVFQQANFIQQSQQQSKIAQLTKLLVSEIKKNYQRPIEQTPKISQQQYRSSDPRLMKRKTQQIDQEGKFSQKPVLFQQILSASQNHVNLIRIKRQI